MAERGRPKVENLKYHKVTIRLDDMEYARLLEYASRLDMTMTDVIRQGVKQVLKGSD